ncbi:MAG: hypothetical protein A2V66_17100 [Ignavibacteria bacterium RBG_13_36_8]|nr:MAG: hypothetical protein A2V66_17100 [Ignavibacteria bacterium RBG_13_36_8]
MHRRIFYVLFFLTLIPTLLMAGTRGRIKGTVVDLQTGDPLIGANVIVMGTSIGAATDANGDFLLLNLEAGVYDVRASYLGYQTITLTNVRVNADLTTYITFDLPSEEVQVGTVTIIAERPLIQKDATNATRITSSEDIQALPIRGVNNILGLTAGVVLQNNYVYIRGGRRDEVGYYLEGVSITNPMAGGRAVTISQDALEEIQVQSGGYTAEFGGANAGIVRQQLRSGSTQFKASFEYITDNVTFKSKDDAFDGEKRLGAFWWGYNEISATLSGPIFDPKYKFFFNFNNVYQRDDNPQPWPGINLGRVVGETGDVLENFYIPAGPTYANSMNVYTYSGTMNLDFTPILIRLSGTYTDTKNDIGQRAGQLNFLNPRVGEQLLANGAFSARLTHVLSPTMFYEISGGYFLQTRTDQDPYLKDNYWAYGDSLANADFGWTWTRSANDILNGVVGRYQRPTRLNIQGFDFTAPGEVPSAYLLQDRTSWSVNGALSFLIGKVHSFKIGGEYQQYTIRQWNIPGNTVQMGFADKVARGDDLTQIMVTSGVDNLGYDVFAQESDVEGLWGAKKPVFAAAYIQDRIEFEDIILNVGLRYDYIDIDNYTMVDPSQPEFSINYNSGAIVEDGWVKTESFSSVSPRLGFSFPVTDRTVFHAQFGKFIQQPRLGDQYQGPYRTGFELRGGFHISQPTGRDVRPTRTTQYEVGFTQQLTDFMSFDITGYYRDVKDQVIFVLQQVERTSPFAGYYSMSNGDFATTKGIELTLNMRRYERMSMNATLSFQDARGTGSFPSSNNGIVAAPLDNVTIFTPAYVTPLSYENAFSGNINIDYRFGPNDGPEILHDFGISVLATFNSGHPFTRGQSGALNYETDSRFRQAIEPLNASSTPSVFNVDLRVDKTFHIWDRLSANVYVYVINIFDALNQFNVFGRTGSTEDDGYITQPAIQENLVANYGESYLDLYNAIQIDYQRGYGGGGSAFVPAESGFLYGPPRQIRFGIRLEY